VQASAEKPSRGWLVSARLCWQIVLRGLDQIRSTGYKVRV